MEDRYNLELRNRNPAEIEELYLDNCKSESIQGLGDNLTKLSNLSLINVGLKSLQGLPVLSALTVLDLSQNKLENGLDILASQCPKLEKLLIADNQFKELSQLEHLKSLSNLISLDTFGNEVEKTPEFRDKIFDLIPNLKDLDGQDINGDPIDFDDEDLGEAEDADDDEVTDEEDEDDDGPGLSYLQNSHIMSDEDETEDYEATDEGEEAAAGDATAPTRRGVKRRHGDDSNDGQSNQ